MRLLLLVLAFLFQFHLCHAQSALEIIERYIDTVSNGDIRNWTRIKSIYHESEGFYSQQAFDGTGPNFSPPQIHYTKMYKVFSPDKLKVELYADSTYNQLLSSSLWLPDQLILEFNNMPPIIKPAKKLRGSYFKPLSILEFTKQSRSVTYTGIKDFPIAGISCFEIILELEDKSLGLYFNINSYLLEYTHVFTALEPDSDFLNYARFTDYKEIDGLLFFMTYYSTRNGAVYHTSTTKRLHINYPIDDEKFRF